MLWSCEVVHRETGLPLRTCRLLMQNGTIRSRIVAGVLVTRECYVTEYLSSVFAPEFSGDPFFQLPQIEPCKKSNTASIKTKVLAELNAYKKSQSQTLQQLQHKQ